MEHKVLQTLSRLKTFLYENSSQDLSSFPCNVTYAGYILQAARGVLRNCDLVTQMLHDWRGMDFDTIMLKFRFATHSDSRRNEDSSQSSSSAFGKACKTDHPSLPLNPLPSSDHGSPKAD